MAEDPPDTTSFPSLQQSLKSALLSTTRTTSALCAEDLPFQRSLDPSFAQDLDAQNARLLSLAEKLLAAAAGGAVGESVSKVRAPKLRDGDELDRNWRQVVDVVDSLLERTDGMLDEVRGILRNGITGNAGPGTEVCCVVRESRAWETMNEYGVLTEYVY